MFVSKKTLTSIFVAHVQQCCWTQRPTEFAQIFCPPQELLTFISVSDPGDQVSTFVTRRKESRRDQDHTCPALLAKHFITLNIINTFTYNILMGITYYQLLEECL